MDRQQMQSCLESVAAYRASSQRVAEWARAKGMPARKPIKAVYVVQFLEVIDWSPNET